jgi:hypothetical protein
MGLGADEAQEKSATLTVGTDFEIEAALDAVAAWLSGSEGLNREHEKRFLSQKLTPVM